MAGRSGHCGVEAGLGRVCFLLRIYFGSWFRGCGGEQQPHPRCRAGPEQLWVRVPREETGQGGPVMGGGSLMAGGWAMRVLRQEEGHDTPQSGPPESRQV